MSRRFLSHDSFFCLISNTHFGSVYIDLYANTHYHAVSKTYTFGGPHTNSVFALGLIAPNEINVFFLYLCRFYPFPHINITLSVFARYLSSLLSASLLFMWLASVPLQAGQSYLCFGNVITEMLTWKVITLHNQTL